MLGQMAVCSFLRVGVCVLTRLVSGVSGVWCLRCLVSLVSGVRCPRCLRLGQAGWARRARVIELDKSGSIETWKRLDYWAGHLAMKVLVAQQYAVSQ
jgi:hypothetical protein